jgi:hypothetical protein
MATNPPREWPYTTGGLAGLPAGDQVADLCRCWRVQRRPQPTVEGRARQAGDRDGPGDHRVPRPAGHLQVEPDRAPAVLAELDELRGRPLVSHQVIVNLIGATTTRTGLGVRAELDRGAYPTGVKVSDAELAAVPLTSRYRALVLVAPTAACGSGSWPACAAAGSTCCGARSRSLRSSLRLVVGCGWGRPRPAPAAAPSGYPGPWSRSWRPPGERRPHRTPSCSPPQRAGRCG